MYIFFTAISPFGGLINLILSYFIYMTKPVWSHVLASSALPSIPDSIRYIIGVFCYSFKSQMNILASY